MEHFAASSCILLKKLRQLRPLRGNAGTAQLNGLQRLCKTSLTSHYVPEAGLEELPNLAGAFGRAQGRSGVWQYGCGIDSQTAGELWHQLIITGLNELPGNVAGRRPLLKRGQKVGDFPNIQLAGQHET